MNTNTYKSTTTIRKPATARIALLITTILLGSCTANAGYRHNDYEQKPSRSVEYHYFPNAHVYYDSHRRVYQYHHKQRGWLSVKKLPKYIHIDKHRRYPVRSDHHKPWKNQHLQKRHRSHFDRHDKRTPRQRHAYKEHSPQHSTMIDQARHNHGAVHQDGNRPHIKHRGDAYKQRKGSGQRALKGVQEDTRPANKFTERNSNKKQTSTVKRKSRKTQNKQQHQESAPRRDGTKQGKNRFARDNRSGRQGENRSRN